MVPVEDLERDGQGSNKEKSMCSMNKDPCSYASRKKPGHETNLGEVQKEHVKRVWYGNSPVIGMLLPATRIALLTIAYVTCPWLGYCFRQYGQ